MYFFGFLFETKLFVFYQYFKSSAVQRNHGGGTKRQFSSKKSPQAEKLNFWDFSLLLHIYPSRRIFFVFIKISYLQPFRKSLGTKTAFWTKKIAAGRKMTFFEILFSVAHLPNEAKLFCFY